jgi:hypothetical protein
MGQETSYSISLVHAQTGMSRVHKHLKTWAFTNDDKEIKGTLIGASDSALFIYPGSIGAFEKENAPVLTAINYQNISLVKVKQRGGVLKGALLGGGIGFAPAFFGEGGAYVAVITFPVGLITGTVVGATAKRKYKIDGSHEAFAEFKHKWVTE